MSSIDERIVAMMFENAKFEAGVATTMKTLAKLDVTLQQIGSKNSLADIEKAANKVTLTQPLTVLDKLRARLFGAGEGAAQGMSDIDKAGNKVTLEQPIQALNKVQSATANVGVHAADGFNEIEKSANRLSFQGLHSSLDSITAKFSVLQATAAVALGNIASQAAFKGFNFAKGFGFGPIIDGLHEYETNLKSIQTVQANTDRPLTEINRSLQELNAYSDQTIYNFSEMARNIGTFTAAGVDLETATSSIKGIANLAALSGSSSQQAATAMYQLSQAISSGRVSLQDWNSVVNAGMGGKKLQTALATTAIAMGGIKEESVKLEGPMKKLTIEGKSFRESIMAKPGQEPWLTSEILVNTLATLDGRFSKAALSAELTKDGLKKYTAVQIEASIADSRASLEKKNGVKYTEAQFKALQKLSDSAFKSATEVKTLSQVFDVAKETIGSGWSASFQSIFGTLTEAKKTFTELSGAINGFINANALARNRVLHDWKALGGRTDLIAGIKNVFKALIAVIKPIGDAFREIFPKKTGKDLAEITKNFRDFTETLKIGPETADKLKRSFAGIFAIFSIGKQIITGILSVFRDLFGAAGSGSDGVLNLTGSLGDFLVSVDKVLKKGEGLTKFFDTLGAGLSAPIKLIGKLIDALGGLSTGVDKSKGLVEALGPIGEKIGEIFETIGDSISNAFTSINFDKVFNAIQVGLIGGMFVAIKKAFGKGFNFEFGGAGMLTNISKSFDVLTKSLRTMQRSVQAATLLAIAAAVAVLTVSVAALAKIDPVDLGKAMTAVAVGLSELVVAMALLTKVGGVAGLPVITASMIALGTALNLIAVAAVIFSKLDWEELARGLAGVAGVLVAVALGMELMPPYIGLISLGLIGVGVALNLLVTATKIFASIEYKDLQRGLIGIAGVLIAIALGLELMPPHIALISLGLIGVGVALNLLAGAVMLFGSMDLDTMKKGIGGIAVALILLGLALSFIPPLLPLQAAGLILLSIALTTMAGAIALMGGMSIKTLAKGIGALAASLIVLGVGLTAMVVALPGAVALLAAAAALAILVPVLGVLGSMNIFTIIKGLGAVALSLVVLSAAGLIATPGLLALGAALFALGLGMTLVSTSVLVLAKGIRLLGKDGVKGIAAVSLAMTALVAILPKIIIDFLKGVVDILEGLALLAPKIVVALAKIIDIVLDVIIKSIPKLIVVIGTLLQGIIKIINDNAADFITAGFHLIVSLFTGIKNNIGKIVPLGIQIVTNFLGALTAEIPRLVVAGVVMITKFLEGIIQGIPKIVTSVVTLVTKFLNTLTLNMPRLISAGARLITSFLQGIANNISKVIAAGGNLIAKIVEGIGAQGGKIVKAGVRTVGDFLAACAQAMLDLTNRIATIIVNFLDGLATAIRTHGPRIRRAGWNVASAIIDGLVDGLSDLGPKVIEKIGDIISALPKKALSILDSNSPSRVFHEIGANVMLGMANGLDAGSGGALRSVEGTTSDLISSMRGQLRAVPDILDGLMDVDPTITPVLDLTNVEAGAKKIGDLTNVTPITAAVSFNQASVISSDQQAIVQATTEAADIAATPNVSFEQNNYSPEALSEVEIYRRTKNQVSQIKTAIGAI